MKVGGTSHITVSVHIVLKSHYHYKKDLIISFPIKPLVISSTDRIKYKLSSMTQKAHYSWSYTLSQRPPWQTTSDTNTTPTLGSWTHHTFHTFMTWFTPSSLQGVILLPLHSANCVWSFEMQMKCHLCPEAYFTPAVYESPGNCLQGLQ